MQLVSMITWGYRRFGLAGHETMTWTPMAPEQVILGSNGSGKSSLVSEIYNIVPSGKDFVTGGGKEEVLMKGSRLFKATSMFPNKAGHHSFMISEDGETWTEHNESGLQTDQYMLVQKHLDLDQDLINLMIGEKEHRLSSMDPTTRRKWMMRICGTNFEYISRLHVQLKKKHRDLKGTVEVLSESLGDALKDMMAISDDVANQANELMSLETLANGVGQKLEDMGASRSSSDILRQKMQTLVSKIETAAGSLPQILKQRRRAFHYLPVNKLEILHQTVADEASQMTGRARALQDRLADVQTAIDTIGRDNLKEPSNVISRIEMIQAEMAEFYENERPNEDMTYEEIAAMYRSTELAIQRLQPILTEMPTVSDMKALKERHATALVNKEALSIESNELDNNIKKLQARLDHFHHVDDVDCPKCSTRFKPGMDAELAAKFEQRIGIWQARAEAVDLALSVTHQVLEEYDTLVTVARQYREVVNQHQEIDDFWKSIDDRRLFYKAPLSVMGELSAYHRKLSGFARYSKLRSELEKQNNIKASLEGDTGHLLDLAEKLENELFDMKDQSLQQQADLACIKEDIAIHQNALRGVDCVNVMVSEWVELARELHKASAFEYLSTVRKQANVRIAMLHGLQAKHKALTARIETLNTQIEDAKEKFGIYKLLDKATSPTEGVVADVVKDFMDLFLELMNDRIAKVWSYDLTIAEMPDKGQSFTCQFPLYVAGNPEPVDDFKNGSTGQVSMIDFVFKVVVFNLLGFKDMPLLADEFGKDFDDEHRERLVNYIRDMIEEKEFSQLFMISHYSSVYSAFESAEFVVIDPRNISVPAEHNTSVTFS